METKCIEACHGVKTPGNHGKFMVGRFTPEEWRQRSGLTGIPLIAGVCGWTSAHLLVLDLATGEGAIFKHGGCAEADLAKRKIWVCPLFQPFLGWLYAQDVTDLHALPSLIELPNASFALRGYRRTGKA